MTENFFRFFKTYPYIEKFGIRKEQVVDDNSLLDIPDYEETSDKASRRAWARLINKIYEVDPLVCPCCGSEMKVIAIIQDRKKSRRLLLALRKGTDLP